MKEVISKNPGFFRNKYLIYFIVLILLSIHFVLGTDTINHLSPTYDEPLHLTAGYSYWKTGKYYLNIYDHPPLAEMFAGIPLIFMKPILLTQHPSWSNYEQYSFANFFLYNNNVGPEKMLNRGRMMILFLSCFLGFMLFSWTKELFGTTGGFLALFLYTFSSAFISNGSLVTTDLALALFYFLSFYTFWKWLNKQTVSNAILTGLCLGFALCSKFSSIVIPGIYFVLFLLYRKNPKIKFSKFLLHCIIVILSGLFVIMLVYRFDSTGLYFEGLYRTFTRLEKGRSSFLSGQYSTTGWWYYFPLTFLIKTPVSLLLLFFAAAINQAILYGNDKKPGSFLSLKENPSLFIIVPALVYFILSSISKVQIGFRHILPIYPFLIIFCLGKPFNVILSKAKNLFTFIIILLLTWYSYSCIKIHPWHLSYFNEFAGTDNGYKYLTDSNVDWGQGMKELGKYLKQKTAEPVFLCYFGVSDPQYYGIKYFPAGFINNLQPQERQGENTEKIKELKKYIFCISATNLQATYYADKQVFSWLKNITPDKLVAKSILVYDLTDNPEALKKLSELYGK